MFKLFETMTALMAEKNISLRLIPNKAKRLVSVKVGYRMVPVAELGLPDHDGRQRLQATADGIGFLP